MSVTYHDRLVMKGLKPTEAQLVEDIAVRAVEEAAKRLVEVVERLPDERLQLVGMIVAYAMLHGHTLRVRDTWTDIAKEWLK